MKWNQLFSHNTRRQEGTADSLLRLLAPSLLGMAVCMLTLCSLTWAWFNMAVGSSITGIQSSEVEVCLVNHNDDGTWTATPLEEDGTSNATPDDTKGNIYFIARGTAANAYLKVECNSTATYYKLDLTSTSVTTGKEYPVYSVQVATSSDAVQVSLIWGTLPEDSTPSETKAARVQDITVSWGGTSTQYLDGNTPTVAYAPQPQPETPANGDTGDNTINDDAKTPDDTTTDDTVKNPSGVIGDTPTGAGDSGTAGTGDSSGTGSDATDGDSGTGGSETGGDADNATNSVSEDAIPAGGSAKASE